MDKLKFLSGNEPGEIEQPVVQRVEGTEEAETPPGPTARPGTSDAIASVLLARSGGSAPLMPSTDLSFPFETWVP